MNRDELTVWVPAPGLPAPEAAELGRQPGIRIIASEPGAGVLDPDAVLHAAPSRRELAQLALRPGLAEQAHDLAVVVLAGDADDAIETELIGLGVEAVVGAGPASDLARTLRQAVLRKRRERATRTAYATDLATGLPHQAQLLEHMAQLLALREREPAPMVLIVLRVAGLEAAAARLGTEAANVLRRKIAVRLRSGLRASDVVASVGPDLFAVLLGRLEAASDGERVAAKLVRAVSEPLAVAGRVAPVTASYGLAAYPTHGKDAERLLRRALAQAAGLATLGDSGFASASQFGTLDDAANDEPGAPR